MTKAQHNRFSNQSLLTISPSAAAIPEVYLNLVTAISPLDQWLAGPEISLGIDAVRSIQQFLKTPPFSGELKLVLAPHADRLTIPAQNAFLKILEEPPHYAVILLGVSHQDQLLETIVSRCVVIHETAVTAKPAVTPEMQSLFESLPKLSLADRVLSANRLAGSRDQALAVTTEVLALLQLNLRRRPDLVTTQRLAAALEAHYHLLHNAHPSLTMEHLFLIW